MASIRAGLREAFSIEDDEELTKHLRRSLRGHPRGIRRDAADGAVT